jgi:hypothetical protein
MSRIAPPAIGEDLYRRLSELCTAARAASTVDRNFHAAALYVALEALRVQAEHREPLSRSTSSRQVRSERARH